MIGRHIFAHRPAPCLCLLLLCVLGAFGAFASAQNIPTVTGAPQLFVQRGQSVDVTVDGSRLDTVTSISLSHPRGLAVTLVEPGKKEKQLPNRLHLHISADKDANLGERELRLIGSRGVSAPLRVAVGQYPEFIEKEPNNTLEQAPQITFPVSLAGKVETPGDVDSFRFAAAKGQTLVFDVHAARARSQLDPLLTIYNEAGKELPTKVELQGADPTVLFEVPSNGRYVLSVRDLQYRGGGDYSYHIDAGEIPYIQSVVPMSLQPGKLAEVRPIGVNLTGAESIPLDLTYAAEGDILVRARASGGLSNAVKVAVNELPAMIDEKPGHSVKDAPLVPMPIDVSGRIAKNSDENYFKFHVARKQVVTLEAIARRIGSPLEPLMTLRSAQGAAMQTAESAGSSTEPVITRELEPGDYLVSLRDLFFNGGPRYAFRMQIRSGAAIGARTQDFSLRFLPDTLRVSRGGNTIVFVDLQRKGDFNGDVTITAEDLPPGVTCPALLMNDKLPGASGMLTLSAAADAPGGSFTFRVRGTATIGTSFVTHEATAVLEAREVDQAYLTVLDAAPFSIEPIPSLSTARVQQLSAEADALATRLAGPNPQVQQAQVEWEKKFAKPIEWIPLKGATLTSSGGTALTTLEDGSFLAGDTSPERDAYTITVPTDAAGITAIRLEAMTDPSLPKNGPGRATSGNFVLSQFSVTIAPKGDPMKASSVVLRDPVADAEQSGQQVISAINPKPGKGWGVFPKVGMPSQAVFLTTAPVGDAKGALLTFTLDHQFGQQHTLGRFRLSITTDPQAAIKAPIPAKIAKLLTVATEKRSADEKMQVGNYYKTVDPQVGADAARFEAIRSLVGVRTEMARLEAALSTDNSEINVQRDMWEKSVAGGSVWTPLELITVKSKSGATPTTQPGNSVLVTGSNPANDVYTVVGKTPIHGITAVRIEALPDVRLPAGGPGRSSSGNFILTKLKVTASAKGDEQKDPVEFVAARASTEQKDHSAASVLTDAKDAGWGILPAVARPSIATFHAKEKFGAAGGSTLTIALEHQFSVPQHTLGHFRIWVTSNAQPDTALTLPPQIVTILKTPADKRPEKQKAEISAYFRSVAPSLDPLRHRLTELRAQVEAEVTGAQKKKLSIPFLVNRMNFKGDLRVTLKGYASKRELGTSLPADLSKALKFDPLEVPAKKASGSFNIDILKDPSTGPRYACLEIRGTVGDETRVEYSAPFVLTTLDK